MYVKVPVFATFKGRPATSLVACPALLATAFLHAALLAPRSTAVAQEPSPAKAGDGGATPSNARAAKNDDDLRYWLRNMVGCHAYSHAEVAAATGLSETEVAAALARYKIEPGGPPPRAAGDPLVVVPYPGGRHPRIGFLEGAVRPQRETKFSVFAPWDRPPADAANSTSPNYVVVDVPEAIWSNLGLLYLAHTHVPTVWTRQGIELPPLEWNRPANGRLEVERKLPNGVAFGAKVVAAADAVRMELWLTNGSDAALSDLRVQNCVLLKGAAGFAQQTNENKILSNPYVACRDTLGTRWIITAWEGCHRPWANEKCPCLHSDPKFHDCPPGQTQRLRGWLSFYEGRDVEAEFRRIEATGWRARDRGPLGIELQQARGGWQAPNVALGVECQGTTPFVPWGVPSKSNAVPPGYLHMAKSVVGN